MATRINTKFVLILAISVFAAGGIIGGLWVLQIRGDTSRNPAADTAGSAEGESSSDTTAPVPSCSWKSATWINPNRCAASRSAG